MRVGNIRRIFFCAATRAILLCIATLGFSCAEKTITNISPQDAPKNASFQDAKSPAETDCSELDPCDPAYLSECGGVLEEEMCDGIDNDCNGLTDEGALCSGTAGCGGLCVEGQCTCPDGCVTCDSQCVSKESYATDTKNCGNCGHACDLPNTAVHQCNAGVCCPEVCEDGYADCNGECDDGCEAEVTDELCDGQDNNCNGVVDEGFLCKAGETLKKACGDQCGVQTMVCTNACEWSALGECVTEGVCIPGTTEAGPCGQCGAMTRTCTNQCVWGEFGACVENGTCTPGATETQACGNCGTQSRTCSNQCTWSSFDACTGQGSCSPGQSQTCGACDTGTSQCNENCEWSACQGEMACPGPEPGPGPNPSEPGVCDPTAPGTGLTTTSTPSFSVAVSAPTLAFPSISNSGLTHYPDGAVSFLGGGGSWEAYFAATSKTYRLTGSSPTSMNLNPGSPVIAPTGNASTPHHAYAGATSVFDCGGARTAFFHAEFHQIPVAPQPNQAPPYHATMCRATGGAASLTVDNPQWVLTSGGAAAYGKKIAYGAGAGSIFDPGGDYLYMYYFDWDSSVGLNLARACRSTCGAPGSWRKWTGTGFSSDALGTNFLSTSGPSTSILPVGPGAFDAFTVVSFNTYLGAYLMASATESGIVLRASGDGINWGPRVWAVKDTKALDVTMRALYPSVFDAGTWSRNETGRHLKLIYGFEATTSGTHASHRAWIVDIELTAAGAAKTAAYDRVTLTRYYHPANPFDHWCTTGPAPGYQVEGSLGKLASNSLPGTRPLFNCVLGGNNHMVSGHSNCEGGTNLGIMGYIWSTPGAGKHPIHRCWMVNGGTGVPDHFVSVDPNCEGQFNEGVLGWVE